METKLRHITRLNDSASFPDVLDKAEKINYLIKLKRSVLLDLNALRNIFAHADREKYIAEVNEIAFEEIRNILKLLNNPPTVGDIFKKNVYIAEINELTQTIIHTMQRNLYTHVPIYDDNKYWGTFTETTILNWLSDNIREGKAEFYKLQIKHVKREYLHCKENIVEFISASTSVFEVQQKFDQAIRKGARLGALLITEHRKKDEKPIGIITAWDLPKIDDYLSKCKIIIREVE